MKKLSYGSILSFLAHSLLLYHLGKNLLTFYINSILKDNRLGQGTLQFSVLAITDILTSSRNSKKTVKTGIKYELHQYVYILQLLDLYYI